MPIQLPCPPSMTIQLLCTPSMPIQLPLYPLYVIQLPCTPIYGYSITMYPLYAYSITLYPLYAYSIIMKKSAMPFNNHVRPRMPGFNDPVPPLWHSIHHCDPPICLFNYECTRYMSFNEPCTALHLAIQLPCTPSMPFKNDVPSLCLSNCQL